MKFNCVSMFVLNNLQFAVLVHLEKLVNVNTAVLWRNAGY